MAHGVEMDAAMTSALWPGAPMARDGSGTSWLPDASPVAAYHDARGPWAFMLHGAAYIRYTDQDLTGAGSRGGSAFDAPNIVMAGVSRPAGRGRFMARTMVSADRLTEGGSGYPLLFQTGESWNGDGLVDGQHPHDLLGELAAGYGYGFAEDAGVVVYAGYPGEPALGPPVYLHRAASWYNPDAPLGHHWQDSTHIGWGVATAGTYYKGIKMDGSVFTGREPDEDRYVPDRPRFDSWCARLSFNPAGEWASQVSYGFLKSPEQLEPGHDVFRTTASILYNRPLADGYVAAAAVWGMNAPSRGGVVGRGTNARLEVAARTPEDLALTGFGADGVFRVGAATLGSAVRVFSRGGADLAAGVQGTAHAVPAALKPIYGGRPFSAEVYLRFSPSYVVASYHHMEMGGAEEHRH